MVNCKECIHFEVCAYVSHYLQACDSYEEPVKHARWNRPYTSWLFPLKIKNPYCFCTNCVHPVKPKRKTKYCPNCGAKMDGGESDG